MHYWIKTFVSEPANLIKHKKETRLKTWLITKRTKSSKKKYNIRHRILKALKEFWVKWVTAVLKRALSYWPCLVSISPLIPWLWLTNPHALIHRLSPLMQHSLLQRWWWRQYDPLKRLNHNQLPYDDSTQKQDQHDSSLSRGLPLARPYKHREWLWFMITSFYYRFINPKRTAFFPNNIYTYLKFNLVSRSYNFVFIPQYFIVKFVTLTEITQNHTHRWRENAEKEGWIIRFSIFFSPTLLYLHSFSLISSSQPTALFFVLSSFPCFSVSRRNVKLYFSRLHSRFPYLRCCVHSFFIYFLAFTSYFLPFSSLNNAASFLELLQGAVSRFSVFNLQTLLSLFEWQSNSNCLGTDLSCKRNSLMKDFITT